MDRPDGKKDYFVYFVVQLTLFLIITIKYISYTFTSNPCLRDDNIITFYGDCFLQCYLVKINIMHL